MSQQKPTGLTWGLPSGWRVGQPAEPLGLQVADLGSGECHAWLLVRQ
jgi:hypothetical protein